MPCRLGTFAVLRDRLRAVDGRGRELRVLPIDVVQRAVQRQAAVEPLAAQSDLVVRRRVGEVLKLVGQRADDLMSPAAGSDTPRCRSPRRTDSLR